MSYSIPEDNVSLSAMKPADKARVWNNLPEEYKESLLAAAKITKHFGGSVSIPRDIAVKAWKAGG